MSSAAAWWAAIEEQYGPVPLEGLAAEVAALSEVYTRRGGVLGDQDHLSAARLRFFFPRDVGKSAATVRDAAKRAPLPAGETWSVLDLGAGFGATGLGLAEVAGEHQRRLQVLAVDRSPVALQHYRRLAAACGHGPLAGWAPVSVETRVADLRRPEAWGPGPFAFILLGLCLNELGAGGVEARLAERVELLRQLRGRLVPDGWLVILEPALREASRDLQRLRDQLLSEGWAPLLPCSHRASCPMLAGERDWCHEEAWTTLPEPLATVARRAGLRADRPTWSALVLPAASAPPPAVWRVVGGPQVEKGRRELTLCGEGRLVRLQHLDRFDAAHPWALSLKRGQDLALGPGLPDRIRTDRLPSPVAEGGPEER